MAQRAAVRRSATTVCAIVTRRFESVISGVDISAAKVYCFGSNEHDGRVSRGTVPWSKTLDASWEVGSDSRPAADR
jgi:hypothetical protein